MFRPDLELLPSKKALMAWLDAQYGVIMSIMAR
jgi:hypothetical protein